MLAADSHGTTVAASLADGTVSVVHSVAAVKLAVDIKVRIGRTKLVLLKNGKGLLADRMAAALLVTGTGCLKSDEAYRSIDWGIITMILGTLGLGMAMDITGAAHTIIEWMMTIIGTWDKRLIVSAVLLFAIIMTEVLSNTAVAALVTPLALSLAHDLGCNWQPFVVAVMAGASIGFAIPAGYQTHMLVFGPGGYRFNDFCRAGIPLDLIMWILGSICIPLFWPL